jgi:NADH:ubiquinone oxidoreductase subunit E
MTSSKGASPASVRAGLLPALKREAGKSGRLSKEALSAVAAEACVPLNDAYGVSTFYTYLPVGAFIGKNIIRVCQCVPCDLRDALSLLETIKKEIGIDPGETTADGRFSLELVNCIGACDQAPAIMINDKMYGGLTPEKIAEILRSF